jgi:hypothetical protein
MEEGVSVYIRLRAPGKEQLEFLRHEVRLAPQTFRTMQRKEKCNTSAGSQILAIGARGPSLDFL